MTLPTARDVIATLQLTERDETRVEDDGKGQWLVLRIRSLSLAAQLDTDSQFTRRGTTEYDPALPLDYVEFVRQVRRETVDP